MSSPQDAARAVAEDAAVFVISVAAELAGMHAQTLRQYDRLGLVSPGRTPGGGRRYSPRDVALLREVQRLSQEDGVNLAGIKRIIDLESQVEALQARVHELLEELELAESRRIGGRGRRPGRIPGRPRARSCRSAGELGARRLASAGRPVSPRRARRRTGRSCGSSARSGCCCAGRAPSPPGWPGELHPDLDGAAYGLLSLLQDAGPLRASELVTRIGLDKSTVSRQVAHLVDLGLVDRAADPVDGRAQVLTPSAEGAARLARIRDVRRARWEDDLSDWPAVRRRDARRPAAPAEPASARRARPRPPGRPLLTAPTATPGTGVRGRRVGHAAR